MFDYRKYPFLIVSTLENLKLEMEEWNKKYPIATQVYFNNQEYSTRTLATIRYGEVVLWLKNKLESVSISELEIKKGKKKCSKQ